MSELLSTAEQTPPSLMPDARQRARLRKIRNIRDAVSRYGVAAAGMAVVGALGLIFLYLFSEVFPLLRSSSVDVQKTYQASSVASVDDPAIHLILERYEEIGASFNRLGSVSFFGPMMVS